MKDKMPTAYFVMLGTLLGIFYGTVVNSLEETLGWKFWTILIIFGLAYWSLLKWAAWEEKNVR